MRTSTIPATAAPGAPGSHPLRLLGPLEVRVDDARVEALSAKQQTVLALLALHADRPVPLSLIIERLWPARPPDTAKAAVRNSISRLRRVLLPLEGVALDTVGSGYQLRVRTHVLDVHCARDLVDAARRLLAEGDASGAQRASGEALALWRGAPLPGLRAAGHDWPEIVGLDRLRLAATECFAEACLRDGRRHGLVPLLERLTREHPTSAALHRCRVEALAGAGRRGDATSAFHHARQVLTEAGGPVEPALLAAHRALLDGAAPRTGRDAGEHRSSDPDRASASRTPVLPAAFPAARAPADDDEPDLVATLPSVRPVTALCVRFPPMPTVDDGTCVAIAEQWHGVVACRGTGPLVVLFGLSGRSDGLEEALAATIAIRRRTTGAPSSGPALAVVTRQALVLDPRSGRTSLADQLHGVVDQVTELAAGTGYGALRVD